MSLDFFFFLIVSRLVNSLFVVIFKKLRLSRHLASFEVEKHVLSSLL